MLATSPALRCKSRPKIPTDGNKTELTVSLKHLQQIADPWVLTIPELLEKR